MEAICKADYDKRVKAREEAERETERNRPITVPRVGFHDCYGIWFFGSFCSAISRIQAKRFGVDREKWRHVFLDVDPGKLDNGIHEVTTHGHECLLYFWRAQGYLRGLVVLADDSAGCVAADVYMESGTWSWLLSEEYKAKLPIEAGNDERYVR